MTGLKPRWKICFFYKDAPYFESENDLLLAMAPSDEFAFTSRLTSGVSFDQERYDVTISYFPPKRTRRGAVLNSFYEQEIFQSRMVSCGQYL